MVGTTVVTVPPTGVSCTTKRSGLVLSRENVPAAAPVTKANVPPDPSGIFTSVVPSLFSVDVMPICLASSFINKSRLSLTSLALPATRSVEVIWPFNRAISLRVALILLTIGVNELFCRETVSLKILLVVCKSSANICALLNTDCRSDVPPGLFVKSCQAAKKFDSAAPTPSVLISLNAGSICCSTVDLVES